MNQMERFMSTEEPAAGDSGGCLDRVKEEPYISVIKSLDEGRRDKVVPCFIMANIEPDIGPFALSKIQWLAS